MHILLYVFDALRADHLPCYGYERETAPAITALAKDGVVFENCFTSTTWTRPVAASILSSTYPGVHQTQTRYDYFTSGVTRLPERLRAQGFQTAGFSTMGNIASEIGFRRGFDDYFDLFRHPDVLAKRQHVDATKEGLMHTEEAEVALPWAEDINGFLLPWLEARQDEDTFAFAWSIETHVPYSPPEGFRRFSTPDPARPNAGTRDDVRSAGIEDRHRLIDLYDDVIYYNDFCLGEIINQLKAWGLYEDTMLIVIGDHGDGFAEHGFYTHGHAPYDELIHVPMIIKFPQNGYSGRRVEGLVELIDIFPTILATAGGNFDFPGAQLMQGQNLLPLIEGKVPQVRRHVFSETRTLDIHNRYLSVRGEQWKYILVERPQRSGGNMFRTMQHVLTRKGFIWDIIRSPRHFLRTYAGGENERLFDLQRDPDEQHNLVEQQPAVLAEYRQILRDWENTNRLLSEQIEQVDTDFEESEFLKRHLQALGYID